MPYASPTGTRRNVAALRRYGWRIMASAWSIRHLAPFAREGWPYALDNGAWSAFQRNRRLDEARFVEAVERYGAAADFVIAPDIVQGGEESLAYSESWLPWLASRCHMALIAVQDGIGPRDVAHLVGPRVGLALGGSTEWKVRELGSRRWRGVAPYLHVLRVNSARRIYLASLSGAASFDGSSPTRFSKNAERLAWAARQEPLL